MQNDFEFVEKIDPDTDTRELAIRGLSPDLETAFLATSSASNLLADRWIYYDKHPEELETHGETKSDGTMRYPEDIISQKIIVNTIRQRHRHDGILAEEGIKHGTERERVWVVDGLDGTGEFAKGTSQFAVGVGLVENGQLKIGVIQHPLPHGFRDIIFAERECGAYFYSSPGPLRTLRVRENALLQHARLLTHRWILEALQTHGTVNPELVDFVTQLRTRSERREKLWADGAFLKQLEKTGSQSLEEGGIDTLGSASLQQAYIAMGVYDGYFSATINPWDAIGTIMIEEAGGKVTDFQGQPRNFFSNSPILATNGFIHDELRHLFEPFFKNMKEIK